jgi:hypothetical protein
MYNSSQQARDKFVYNFCWNILQYSLHLLKQVEINLRTLISVLLNRYVRNVSTSAIYELQYKTHFKISAIFSILQSAAFLRYKTLVCVFSCYSTYTGVNRNLLLSELLLLQIEFVTQETPLPVFLLLDIISESFISCHILTFQTKTFWICLLLS